MERKTSASGSVAGTRGFGFGAVEDGHDEDALVSHGLGRSCAASRPQSAAGRHRLEGQVAGQGSGASGPGARAEDIEEPDQPGMRVVAVCDGVQGDRVLIRGKEGAGRLANAGYVGTPVRELRAGILAARDSFCHLGPVHHVVFLSFAGPSAAASSDSFSADSRS